AVGNRARAPKAKDRHMSALNSISDQQDPSNPENISKRQDISRPGHVSKSEDLSDVPDAATQEFALESRPSTKTVAETSSNPEHKVSIRSLNFYYGESQALKNVSLPLYANKVTAFIGPSGCGKSTLLRILNRMYDLYPNQRAEGEVLLDGVNILRREQDLNLL